MTLPLYLAFVIAAAVLLIIPGPTVLLVIGYGLTEGRRSLWSLVCGVALGDALALTGSVAGLGAVLAASAAAFTVLKYCGAVYLVSLGWTMLRSKAAEATPQPARSPRRTFTHAFAVTAANPKSILFFVAFLPQFVNPAQPAGRQLVLLGATFVLLSAINTATYAALAASAGSRLQNAHRLSGLTRLGGGVAIGAGLLTAMAKR